jgi:hypothetical protein
MTVVRWDFSQHAGDAAGEDRRKSDVGDHSGGRVGAYVLTVESVAPGEKPAQIRRHSLVREVPITILLDQDAAVCVPDPFQQ